MYANAHSAPYVSLLLQHAVAVLETFSLFFDAFLLIAPLHLASHHVFTGVNSMLTGNRCYNVFWHWHASETKTSNDSHGEKKVHPVVKF